MSCVVDTNLLIYFLGEAVEAPVLQRIEQALRDQARISVITRMEVLGWRGHTGDSRARADKPSMSNHRCCVPGGGAVPPLAMRLPVDELFGRNREADEMALGSVAAKRPQAVPLRL